MSGGGRLLLDGTSSDSSVLNLAGDLRNTDFALETHETVINGPGQLVNEPGRSVFASDSTWNAPLVNQGTLTLRRTNTLAGPLTTASTSLIQLQGYGNNNAFDRSPKGDVAVTVTSGFTNLGEIQLFSHSFGGFDDRFFTGDDLKLTVNGGALVNEGIIRTRVPGHDALVDYDLVGQVENRGTIRTDQSTSTPSRLTNLKIDVTNNTVLNNSGLINVVGGNLTVINASGVTSSGEVRVAAARRFTFPGDFNQASGTTSVMGTLDPVGKYALSGGRLEGTGIVLANVTNSATVAPGADGIGTLSVQGSYTQQTTGILDVQIAALDRFSTLAVTGTAAVGGDLHVSLKDGYIVQPTDIFRILTAGQVTNQFASSNASDERLSIAVNAQDVTLAAVSLPNQPPVASDANLKTTADVPLARTFQPPMRTATTWRIRSWHNRNTGRFGVTGGSSSTHPTPRSTAWTISPTWPATAWRRAASRRSPSRCIPWRKRRLPRPGMPAAWRAQPISAAKPQLARFPAWFWNFPTGRRCQWTRIPSRCKQ